MRERACAVQRTEGEGVSNDGDGELLWGSDLAVCLPPCRHLAEGLSIVKAHFSDSSTDIMDPQLSNSPQ